MNGATEKTITKFVIERIRMDEARALHALERGDRVVSVRGLWLRPGQLLDAARWRRSALWLHREVVIRKAGSADVTARVCATCQGTDAIYSDGSPALAGGAAAFPCPTLRHFATVDSHHPDFREEWRLDRGAELTVWRPLAG